MLTRSLKVAVAASSILASFAAAQYGPTVDEGCWSANIGGIVFHNSSALGNSWGACAQECYGHGGTVMALQRYDCWCGTQLPPVGTTTANSSCSVPCPYYPDNTCGGDTADLYTVLLTGLIPNSPITHRTGSDTSKSPSQTSTGQSSQPSSAVPTTEVQRVTVVPTQNVTVSPSSSSSSGGSKAGIAAGVVVAIVAIAAICGGVYFFLRQRRRKELEKSHRRQSSVTAFASTQRAPHMSVLPTQDSRLDPAIAAKRQSDGSIADNQDFSRRVLKVTNPDDRW